MVKARVVGEIHSSSKDVQALKEMVESEEHDAVFLEGRKSKVFECDWKFGLGYVFFLLGWLVWSALRRLLYVSKEPVVRAAKKLDVPVFDRVDATIPRIYEIGRNFPVTVLFFISLLLLCLSLTMTVPSLVGRAIGFIVLLSSLSLLYFTLIAVYSAGRRREKHIADFIAEKIEASGFNSILVSCGASHASGIEINLNDKGIDVEKIELCRFSGLEELIKVLVLPMATFLLVVLLVEVFNAIL